MAGDVDGNELARLLRPFAGPVTIEDLTRLPGGASKQTWSFAAVGAGGIRTELVLRCDPPGRPTPPRYRERRVPSAWPARLAWPCRNWWSSWMTRPGLLPAW